MKTLSRTYGTRRRMTASGLPPSQQESKAKDIQNGGDLREEVVCKDPEVLHETRSQTQASKKRLHEDVTQTTKNSSLSVVPETATNSVGVATRSSTRPAKRIKLSIQPSNKAGNQEHCGASDGVPSLSSPQTNRRKKQTKRQWESWGKAEKDMFFEALHEYGKDFDRIYHFIATKHKRRGDPPALIKNKDQVRHFYYRSLNKITKYLPADHMNESDNHKKMVTELRGLICYGELRKKIYGWNDKHGKKLEELLNHGTISIRNRGRNFKIKAPACRALKRLTSAGQSKDDGDSQSLPLPTKISLELVPRNHAAWAAVQRLSKNPRLRTSVPPKKPLSLMLNFLTKKWQVLCMKTLQPLTMQIIIPSDFHVSRDVDDKQTGSPSCQALSVHSCPVENGGQDTVPSTTAEYEQVSNDSFVQNNLQTASVGAVGDCNNKSGEMGVPDITGAVDLSPNEEMYKIVANVENSSPKSTFEPMDSCYVEQPEKQDETGSCAKTSHPTFWSLDTCGNITFGEIFCGLGRPEKLKLEYTWHGVENNLAPSQTAISLTKLIDAASIELTKGKEANRNPKVASKTTNSLPDKNPAEVEAKEKGSSKDKVVSKPKGAVTKVNKTLPFILPSVVSPAAKTSKETVVSDLLPLSQTRPKGPRMHKRQHRPPVHRTLLPRPVRSPSSVPPGAVAVSFIPQPGQTVGTILAAGVSTSTSTGTTQSKASLSPRSVQGVPSCPNLTTTTSPPSNRSSPPVATKDSFTSVSSSLDMELSEFTNSELLNEVMDQFDVSTKSLSGNSATTSNPVDSIIGLALGTALDNNETSTSMAGLDLTAESISTFDSSAALGEEVHVEELNSGVAGCSVPSSIASPTLENILNPAGIDGQLPPSTNSNVFFTNTSPITSVLDSQSQQGVLDKESIGEGSLLLSPSTDSGLYPTFPPQWLNGESSNFSIGSLLDKLSSSPKKEDRTVGLQDSSGERQIKEPSEDLLLNSHHLLDAETAFHAMMDENSVDFVRKFQDLAKEVAAENNSKNAMSSSASLTFASLLSTEASRHSSEDNTGHNLSFRSILQETNVNGS
ncbi:protein cramped-like isoform X1 [Montipora foliosa]|uniref:protein cramped-like isoform X1 n=1 Tax=Montipora foliosa TaxID=591990 RepID=UPI0035F10538